MAVRTQLFETIINVLTKMSYFSSQEVENPVQIIKYDELSRFQPILKLSVTFVESLFTLKPFLVIFTNSNV